MVSHSSSRPPLATGRRRRVREEWRRRAIDVLREESIRLDGLGEYEARVRSESLMRAVSYLLEHEAQCRISNQVATK